MAVLGRRQPFKPIILKGLVGPQQPPIARLLNYHVSQDQARLRLRQPYHATILKLGSPPSVNTLRIAKVENRLPRTRPYKPTIVLIKAPAAPANPPVGKVRQFPPYNPRRFGKIILLPVMPPFITPPVLPTPTPTVISTGPLLRRHPKGRDERDPIDARNWDILSTMVNSLLTTGQIIQAGPTSYQLAPIFPFGQLVYATDGPTVTFSLSASRQQAVILGGNRTLTFAGYQPGMLFFVTLIQDSIGGRSVTYSQPIRWTNGSQPGLATLPNRADTFLFHCLASGGPPTFLAYILGQNL